MNAPIPSEVLQLLWDMDPSGVLLETHASLILERVMTRGSLEAMRWLLAAFDTETMRGFVLGPRGRALPPRELAFWSTILGLTPSQVGPQTGGGRPGWTG